MLSFENKTLKS